MDHNFWFAVWNILATVITSAFASYHGAKKGSE